MAYESREALGVSICWLCMGGNTSCARCRERGVFVSDFRVGSWPNDLSKPYDPQGGFGHRFARWHGSLGVMRCGKRIPRKHFGGGEAVVPSCRFCWGARGFGY